GAATATDSKTSVVTTETAAPPPPSTITGYTLGLLTVPNTPNISAGYASDINNSGEVVGNYILPVGGVNVSYGFTIVSGLFNTAVVPGSISTRVTHVNNQGDFVGTYEIPNGGVAFGFVHHGDAYITIPLVSESVDSIDINDKGQVALSTSSGTAYVYDDNTG